jgi:putative membrane protein
MFHNFIHEVKNAILPLKQLNMSFTHSSSDTRTPLKSNYWLWMCIISFLILWVVTYLNTNDLNNWFIENALTVITLFFLVKTYRSYPFSDVSYVLMTLFLCLHVYGSQYTYAENPLGYKLQDLFNWKRNHYDRIVHFSFGFLLAYPVRELFCRAISFPKSVSWILPIELTLSVSALYELIEWAVADIFFKAQGAAYLGTQGDYWDAQKDIFLALLGAAIGSSFISIINRYFKII